MSTPIQLAAQRINAATAGVTGKTAIAVNEPGAPLPATATEAADHIPTEFGGLTHLFGGEAQPSTQYEPMQTAVTVPGGSVRGVLGGLKPDFTNTVQKAIASVKETTTGSTQPAAAKAAPVPLSVAAKNTITKARAFLKI